LVTPRKVNDDATYHIAIERVSSSAAATRPPGGSPAGDNLLVALAIDRTEATGDDALEAIPEFAHHRYRDGASLIPSSRTPATPRYALGGSKRKTATAGYLMLPHRPEIGAFSAGADVTASSLRADMDPKGPDSRHAFPIFCADWLSNLILLAIAT